MQYTMFTSLLLVSVMLQPVFTFCPYGCGCDEEKSLVTCIRAGLEVMPISLNPSIRTLILKYNEFHTVDASFNFYPKLELVDLSHNGIISIPGRGFSNQRTLQDLRLNHNKISQISQDTFHGLRLLKSLELRTNYIQTLPENFLSQLESLEILDLGNNQISEIHPNAFSGLTQLRILKLDDNNLNRVPQGLENLPELVELYLNLNKIQFIPDSSFLLPTLSILDLSANKLERIHERGFESLANLRSLKLQGNSLYEIPSPALSSLQSLEKLFIGQNKYLDIKQNSFSGLLNLHLLDISGCPALTSIQGGAFSENQSLKKIVLASNKNLKSLDPLAFQDVVSLEYMDLSNNGLEYIPSSLLAWHRLKHLQISGNPLNCDCSNYFLKDVIYGIVNSSETIRVVRCWTPLHLRDRDLALLELDCDVTSSSSVQDSDILTGIIVSTVVSILLFISLLLIYVRARRSKLGAQVPVKDKDILQYVDLGQSGTTQPLSHPNIVVNPYHDNQPGPDMYFGSSGFQGVKSDHFVSGHHMHGSGHPIYGSGQLIYGSGYPMYGSGHPMYAQHEDTELVYSDPHQPQSSTRALIQFDPKNEYEEPVGIL